MGCRKQKLQLFQPVHSSQTTAYIYILDINDNSPICPVVNTFTLTDDIDVGVTFGKVDATDPDEGLNGSLSYRLQVDDVSYAIHDNGTFNFN